MSGRTGVNTNRPTPIAPASAAPVWTATDHPERVAVLPAECDPIVHLFNRRSSMSTITAAIRIMDMMHL